MISRQGGRRTFCSLLSSLLGPKSSIRRVASSVVRPSSLVLRDERGQGRFTEKGKRVGLTVAAAIHPPARLARGRPCPCRTVQSSVGVFDPKNRVEAHQVFRLELDKRHVDKGVLRRFLFLHIGVSRHMIEESRSKPTSLTSNRPGFFFSSGAAGVAFSFTGSEAGGAAFSLTISSSPATLPFSVDSVVAGALEGAGWVCFSSWSAMVVRRDGDLSTGEGK